MAWSLPARDKSLRTDAGVKTYHTRQLTANIEVCRMCCCEKRSSTLKRHVSSNLEALLLERPGEGYRAHRDLQETLAN